MDQPAKALIAVVRDGNAMTSRSVVVALVLLFAAIVGTALGFNEPDGFRGVPWGATEAQVRKAIHVSACDDIAASERWMGNRYCFAELSIGDVSVEATYTFRGNKFVRVGLHFAPRTFDRMLSIFRERYGEPTRTKRDFAEWAGVKVSITVQRYLSQGTSGFAMLVTRAEMEEATRIRDQQTKDAAKGL
jgi:hypothetical protein